MDPLPIAASDERRAARHAEVFEIVGSLLEGEDDWIAAMATVSCELHHAFAYYDWTGFYRVGRPNLLIIGPYQGRHGCLRIPFERGVCGAAARTKTTQCVDDVELFADHITCSTSTRSEIVVPIVTPSDALLGVLDIDSDAPSAFQRADRQALERLCRELGRRFAQAADP